jgi:peptidyl-prolyl cis-trans isomerase D
MLSSIRKFSKTIIAKIFLVIIIIPFVFWGMGGVFNSGNTNNVAKLNDYNISTQDFIDFINNSKIDSKTLKENIDKNILEEILSNLISRTMLDMEIKNLNLFLSEDSLAYAIRNNKNFSDETKKFSRIKYEKFLLSQNLAATEFEKKYKNAELKKKLFSYISGGIKAPIFLTNRSFLEQTSKLEISFFSLKDKYKKKENITDKEVKSFIKENENELKNDYIDFTYTKIAPQDLTGSPEFSEFFYKKIDEIENKISNGSSLYDLKNEYKFLTDTKENFIISEKSENFEKKIYELRDDVKIQLIEEDKFYIIYQVDKISNTLPLTSDQKFLNEIKNILFENNKYEYNQSLLSEINNKKFDNERFKDLSNNNIKNITLNSIKDTKKFTEDSLKILYSLPIKSFTLVADLDNNIYIAKINNIIKKNISKTSSEFKNFSDQANIKIRDNLYSSYDLFLNDEYEIIINQKTLERVKNYFK